MAGLDNGEICRRPFVKLKIFTVVNIYIFECLKTVCSKRCHRLQDTHNHQTRNGPNFRLPAHHLKLFESKPSYAGAKFFNALPEEFKTLDRKGLKKLQQWLLQRPFYNVSEFFNWKDFTLS